MELLSWLESTRLATFVRESNSILAYPTILFLHTLGLAMVAGFSAVFALRVLGFARRMPLSALSPFIAVLWTGFAMTVVSGTALLIADTSKMSSPIFLIKLTFVAFGIVTVHLLIKRVYRNPLADKSPLPPQAQVLAALSLAFWVAATMAGRLIAYIV